MAKTTRASGPSYTDHEMSDEDKPVQITRAMLGRVDQSPEQPTDGGDSSPSSKQPQQPEDQNKDNNPQPAQSAENPSEQQGESSTVLLTDGSGQESSPAEDDAILPYEEWIYSDLQAECKERELPASGKKEELVARLIEDDEQRLSEDL